LGLIGQPQSLNPVIENDAALRELTPLLFETLLRVDPHTAQLQPGLAQSWRYAGNGKQVTFQLPANLSWSDGTSLTAATIVESLQATHHPALLAFEEITAPDDQTLTLTFSMIDCSAVTALSQLPLIPASQILDPTPMGSGPFMLADGFENHPNLTLIQNPNYHGQPPLLDGLIVRLIKESEAEIALSEGQFDAIGPVDAGILAHTAPENLIGITYRAPQIIYVAINFEPSNEAPVLPATRQALVLALDRAAILAEVLEGEGQLLAGPLLPDHWAANQDLALPAYDPDAARALLDQAGLADTDFDGWLDQDGQKLELAIRVNGMNPLHQKLGWLVSSYYRDLGLLTRAESTAPDSVIDDLFTHDFKLALFHWPLLPDPDQRLFWHSRENEIGQGLNFTSYHNPQLDRLLNKGIRTPGCRPEDRLETYTQIQQILSQDRPVDFLMAPNRRIFVAGRLYGLDPGPFAPFTWNASLWFLQ
jgi:peptide/nickel transport system substrate-binding protein